MTTAERDVRASGDYGTMSEPIELQSIPGDYGSTLAAGVSNIEQPKTATGHGGRNRQGQMAGRTDRSSIRVHSAKGSDGLVLKQQLSKGRARNDFLEQMGLATVDAAMPPRTAGNFMGARNKNEKAANSSVNNDRFTSTSTANGPRPAFAAQGASKRPPSGRIFTGSKDLQEQ